MLMRGERRPSGPIALRLHKLTGVPLDKLVDPVSRAKKKKQRGAT